MIMHSQDFQDQNFHFDIGKEDMVDFQQDIHIENSNESNDSVYNDHQDEPICANSQPQIPDDAEEKEIPFVGSISLPGGLEEQEEEHTDVGNENVTNVALPVWIVTDSKATDEKGITEDGKGSEGDLVIPEELVQEPSEEPFEQATGSKKQYSRMLHPFLMKMILFLSILNITFGAINGLSFSGGISMMESLNNKPSELRYCHAFHPKEVQHFQKIFRYSWSHDNGHLQHHSNWIDPGGIIFPGNIFV